MSIVGRPIHGKPMICERCENERCSEQGRWNGWMGDNPESCSSFEPQEKSTTLKKLEIDFSKGFQFMGGFML